MATRGPTGSLPKPTPRTIDLPADIGRDWAPDDLSKPVRLDLDGDGTMERVEFLAEPAEEHDGRTRVQTTLSSTGEEAYGLVELGTTIGVGALDPIDADSDGDQELVLYTTDVDGGPGAPSSRSSSTCATGCWSGPLPEDPELLASGDVVVPGSETQHYDRVHVQTFRVEGATLVSTRSVNAFARSAGSMTMLVPETYVMDTYEPDARRPGCPAGGGAGLPRAGAGGHQAMRRRQRRRPALRGRLESTDTIGVGEQVALEDGGLGYRARVEDDGGPNLVIDGPGADGSSYALNAPEPRVHVVSPASLVGFDAASAYVTSATDPGVVEIVAQTADQAGLVGLRPVGEVPLGTGTQADGRDYRTWLTENGSVVTMVAGGDGSWESWQWVPDGQTDIAALPTGTVCFDDVTDPASLRRC